MSSSRGCGERVSGPYECNLTWPCHGFKRWELAPRRPALSTPSPRLIVRAEADAGISAADLTCAFPTWSRHDRTRVDPCRIEQRRLSNFTCAVLAGEERTKAHDGVLSQRPQGSFTTRNASDCDDCQGSNDLVEWFYVSGASVGDVPPPSHPPADNPSSLIRNAGLGSNARPVLPPSVVTRA